MKLTNMKEEFNKTKLMRALLISMRIYEEGILIEDNSSNIFENVIAFRL